MAYAALYRRLRPNRFKDVIGQQHIIKTLINQISMGRVSHAYLFCGTRGTGKTTTARLFAHAVNCLNPKDGEPCNICEVCEAISAGRSLDVIEIDAASNNSVDNVRDLREEIKYPPTYGKYKVYIIDEVHMLSSGAFNALLKTLEEPPGHIIFILATTDPQKIPPTIHSRCQRFDFKRITSRGIFVALQGYVGNADSEQVSSQPATSIEPHNENLDINIDDNALLYIASLADGSMRDALSILEQCSAFYVNQRITTDNVREIVGTVDKSVFYELTDALISFDTNKCMGIIADIVNKGRDINQFVNDLTVHLRNLLVVNEMKESESLDISFENTEKLTAQSGRISPIVLIEMINTFSLLNNQLRYASNERIILETTCIKLCNPATVTSGASGTASHIASLEQRINALTTILDKKDKSINLFSSDKTKENFNLPESKEAEIVNEKKNNPPEPNRSHQKKATPDDINTVIKEWKAFAAEFSMPLRVFLQKTDPAYLEGNSLQLVTDEGCAKSLKNHEEIIKDRLEKKYGHSFEINIIDKGKFDEQHKKLYGTGNSNEFNPSDFTDKINMDIIFEN